MAALPQFEPMQAPGTQASLDLQGQNDAQSWMTQAANRAQIQANTGDIQSQARMRDLQSAILQAQMPALVAKGQADALAAQNEIASATLQQQYRAQWQSLKPQVIQDLAAIHDPSSIPTQTDGTPDWMAIYNKYEALQAKYGALNLFPEGKQYYDMIEQGKKNAFDLAARHEAAQLTLNQLKLASTMRLNNTEAAQNNAATLSTATKPAVAQAEAANTQRNQAFTDIASQRDALSQMGFAISNLGSDVAKEQASPVSMTAARFAGPAITGKFSAPVQQVEQDIGDFANRIMASVKNIRNVNEFRAVTASIPRADDQPDVQNEKLSKLQQINQILTQRNDYKEQILRSDPTITPDQADQRATSKYPFPSSIMAARSAPESSTPISPADAAKLAPGTHFIGLDGIERVKN